MTNAADTEQPARLGGAAARKAAKYTVLFQTLSKIAGLVVVVMLVRMLSEAQYGAYNIYYSIIGFIGTVASFGISNTLARFLPEYHNKHQDAFAHRLYQFASIARLLSNFLVLLLLWLLWEPVSQLLQLESFDDAFPIFAAVVITYFQASILTTTLGAYLLQQHSFGSQLIFGICKILGYLVLVGISSIDIFWVLAVDFVAYAAMYIWQKTAYQRLAPRPCDKTPVDVPAERKRVLRYAFFYNFSDLGQFSVGNRVDFLFLAAMADPVIVGAYGLARKIEKISTNLLPVKFFQGVVRPLFFTLDHNKSPERVNDYFRILTKITYILLFPLCTFMVVAYESISQGLLGGKFDEFTALIAVIFCFALLTGFQKPLMLVIQLSEKAGVIFLSKLFGLLNLVGLYFLIPIWGAVGAAVATGATVVMSRLFLWWFVRHIITVRGLGVFSSFSVVYWAVILAAQIEMLKYLSHSLVSIAACGLATAVATLLYFRGPLFSATDQALLVDGLSTKEISLLRRVGILNHEQAP